MTLGYTHREWSSPFQPAKLGGDHARRVPTELYVRAEHEVGMALVPEGFVGIRAPLRRDAPQRRTERLCTECPQLEQRRNRHA